MKKQNSIPANNMKNIGLVFILTIMTIVCFNCSAVRAEDETAAGKKSTVSKEIEGIVSGIGYGSISVVYQSDVQKGTAEEMLLPLDELQQIVHKQDISQINVGDTVSVQYDETTQEAEKGVNILRKAKIINFIKPAASETPIADVPETDTSATEVLK